MTRLGNIIKMFSARKAARQDADVAQLRTAFRERYHHFKLLLNANNKALEGMAEMEEALKGIVPFGMAFVRSQVTRVSTNVFQIIKHLNELAPGKYDALNERFNQIQEQINPFMALKPSVDSGPLVEPLEQIDRNSVDLVGSKMANLGEVANQLQVDVPDGFVVTASAYHHFMAHSELQLEIDRRIQTGNLEQMDQLYNLSGAIQQLIINAPLPDDLYRAISDHCQRLEKKEGRALSLAMRSSGIGEDFAGTSFAGQYRTELNIHPDNIHEAYKEIVASKYNLQAITYRMNRGIPDEDVAMCVGCLEMVEAVSGGVLYSRNPVDIRDNRVIINSVWGLPKLVVDGSTNPDLFVLSKGDPPKVEKKVIALKEMQLVSYPDEGIHRMDLSGKKTLDASLSDAEAISLAQKAMDLEAYYGIPQDIEWAIDPGGRIVILQCRPLQQIQEEVQNTVQVADDSILLRGGVTASPGSAAGPVFIAGKDADALRFPDGAVLVVAQSLPRWATLLNRAVAVISEQGSVAGHLANVAREFRIPSVFGVKGACDILQTGQIVTVDADGMRITRGRNEALLTQETQAKNLMDGSPIFENLRSVIPFIVSLNLLDPDAPDFRPRNCKTYHDITRFCHEKAVKEMFQFGEGHHFPERSSKQLVCEIPMKWWVLNLDDGFREEEDSKFVRLENIVSIPMLALWEGIAAIPWRGPPAIDGRGFLSVMFEATTNPALVAGGRSRYTDRNYFMVSRDYCSFNSRLGFHFSTVETLVSDRTRENYISFQFKGGAADGHRRQKRIVFITNLLEEYGFRVEMKGDHLIARVENHERDLMIDSLKILGYLTIHTRQLDMIMTNDATVGYYRQKIRKDISDIVAPG